MGWLQDAMQGRFDSFNQLAGQLLGHPDWRSEKVDKRSLGNVLRELDQGRRAPWLQKRPAVQQLLATLLELEAEEVADRLADAERGRSSVPTRIPLTDLHHEARDIDLLNEDLFPGIPALVTSPRQWRRHWWKAPGGSGRTIAGKWLEARGAARFIPAITWLDARQRLPDGGTVYVELESPEGLQEITATELPKALNILVSAPFLPYADPKVTKDSQDLRPRELLAELPDYADLRATKGSRDVRHGGWELVETPTLSEWLPDLLLWVSARMRPGGGLRYEDALNIFHELGADSLFDTPGAVLGFCGLLEQFGAAKIRKMTRLVLVEAYLRNTLERNDRSESAVLQWLRDKAAKVLADMARGLLFSEDSAWDTPQPASRWVEFLTPDVAPPPDIAGVRKILRSADALEKKRIDQALRRLTPGPEEAVRALIDVHLLEPRAEGRYVIRPIWVINALVLDAIEKLPSEPPELLGEALLRPHLAGTALERLLAVFKAGDFAAARRAVDALDETCPARVAAVEGCFRALGIATLQGAVPDIRLLSSIWRAQQAVAFPRYDDWPPGPRIRITASHDRPSMLDDGAFYLACLAISERLDRSDTHNIHPLLDPWHHQTPPAALSRILDQIGFATYGGEGATPAEWLVPTYALAGRLAQHLGPTPAPHYASGDCHPLQAPTLAVLAVREGGPTAQLPAALGFAGDPLAGIETEAARLGVRFEDVVVALWWDRTRSKNDYKSPIEQFLRDHPEHAEKLWRLAPPDVLRHDGLITPDRRGVPYSVFTHEQWNAFLDVWHLNRMNWHAIAVDMRYSAPWQAMPEVVAERVLRSEELDPFLHDILAIFWQRHPETVQRCLLNLLQRHSREKGFRLLWSAPEDRTHHILQLLQAWSEETTITPEDRSKVCRWLHDRVARRSHSWRDAYGMMVRLQREPVSISDITAD